MLWQAWVTWEAAGHWKAETVETAAMAAMMKVAFMVSFWAN